jgi:hypothetical protein
MQSVPPLAHTIAETCRLIHSGKTAVYREIKLRKLRAVKQGRSTKVLDTDLRRYLEGLPPIHPADT